MGHDCDVEELKIVYAKASSKGQPMGHDCDVESCGFELKTMQVYKIGAAEATSHRQT